MHCIPRSKRVLGWYKRYIYIYILEIQVVTVVGML